MEYCASAQALLAENLCQIVEGFVEYFKIRLRKKFSQDFPQNVTIFPQLALVKPLFLDVKHLYCVVWL